VALHTSPSLPLLTFIIVTIIRAVGDVIGCCIDLTGRDGVVTFYKNGVSMGTAFSNVHIGASGQAYFPAITLSCRQRSRLNFGGHPFEYPLAGYLPIQAPPPLPRERKMEYLLHALERLLPHVFMLQGGLAESSSSSPSSYVKLRGDEEFPLFPLSDEDSVILAARIFEHLGVLLMDKYVVVDVWVRFLMRLLLDKDASGSDKESPNNKHNIEKKGEGDYESPQRPSASLVQKLLRLVFICMEVTPHFSLPSSLTQHHNSLLSLPPLHSLMSISHVLSIHSITFAASAGQNSPVSRPLHLQ